MPGGASLFLKLLTAHLVGDYLFQSSRAAAEKYRPAFLVLHAAAHGVLLAIVGLTEPATSALWIALPVLLAAHIGIDAWTSRVEPRSLHLLALDQALHLATIAVAVAIARPEQGAGLLRAMAASGQANIGWIVLRGALVAVPAGAVVVGRWVLPFRDALSDESRDQRTGLESAGRWIGILERLVVYLAVLAHVETLIGFVIALKAVLRLPEAKEKWSRELAEYYLAGSLASLAWALLVALAVRAALAAS